MTVVVNLQMIMLPKLRRPFGWPCSIYASLRAMHWDILGAASSRAPWAGEPPSSWNPASCFLLPSSVPSPHPLPSALTQAQHNGPWLRHDQPSWPSSSLPRGTKILGSERWSNKILSLTTEAMTLRLYGTLGSRRSSPIRPDWKWNENCERHIIKMAVCDRREEWNEPRRMETRLG